MLGLGFRAKGLPTSQRRGTQTSGIASLQAAWVTVKGGSIGLKTHRVKGLQSPWSIGFRIFRVYRIWGLGFMGFRVEDF